MKDYYTIGRRNVLLASVAVVIAIAAYAFIVQPWLAKRSKEQANAAAHDAEYRATEQGVEANGFTLKAFFAEETRIIRASSSCTMNLARSFNHNDAAFDAGMAKCNYVERQARIAHSTAFCNQWALCNKGEPYQVAFNGCYAAFGPHDDESSDETSDDDGQ